MGLFHNLLKLLQVLGLVENPGLDLVGPAPIRDRVKILGQRSVAEDLGFLVLGVFREWEGVVRGGAAEEEQSSIAEVLPELGVGGGWRRRS